MPRPDALNIRDLNPYCLGDVVEFQRAIAKGRPIICDPPKPKLPRVWATFVRIPNEPQIQTDTTRRPA